MKIPPLTRAKMTSSSREEKGFEAKQEGNVIDFSHVPRAISSTSRSSLWSAFRNPRIVRVARSFGGKDRHSKVFTIRGLRDRRIRLSVPAAIQLYDLQEKLGLNQPSKVIDWLLNVTQCDIDKLPPLQFPQDYNQFNAPMAPKLWFPPFLQTNSTSTKLGLSSKDIGIDINEDLIERETERMSFAKSNLLNMGDLVRTRSKEIERESVYGKGKWINNSNVQESLNGIGSDQNDHVMPQNFMPMSNYNFSLSSNLSNNRIIPYYQCESSNSSSSSSSSSSSQFGIGFARASEQYCINTNASSSSSSFILPSRAQFCFCPPPQNSTPLIPSYSPNITTPLMESEMGSNHHQFFSSPSSQHVLSSFMPSLHLVSPPLLPSSTNFRLVAPLSKNSCQTNEHDDSS